MLVTCNKWPTN